MLREIFSHVTGSAVIGYFDSSDIVEDLSLEGYSIDAWGQFQASADSLRGYRTSFILPCFISIDLANFPVFISAMPVSMQSILQS